MTDSPNTTNLQDIGHRLRVTRLALGLSEAEAAAEFAVTLRTYRRYETGRIPSRGLWGIDFCRKYNVSLDWLWCGSSAWLAPHLSQRSKGRVAILPTEGAKDRARRIAGTLCSILPGDSRTALAAIYKAKHFAEVWLDAKELSNLVAFPKSY